MQSDKWIVDAKGGPFDVFEISVIRQSFEHGRESFGWFENRKRYISGSGGPCQYKVSNTVWLALLKVAQDEADRLNRLYNE